MGKKGQSFHSQFSPFGSARGWRMILKPFSSLHTTSQESFHSIIAISKVQSVALSRITISKYCRVSMGPMKRRAQGAVIRINQYTEELGCKYKLYVT